MKKKTSVEIAVDAAGSQTRLAAALGRDQQLIWYWLKRGKELSGEDAVKVEQEFGVSRQTLRPDLYEGMATPSPTTKPQQVA